MLLLVRFVDILASFIVSWRLIEGFSKICSWENTDIQFFLVQWRPSCFAIAACDSMTTPYQQFPVLCAESQLHCFQIDSQLHSSHTQVFFFLLGMRLPLWKKRTTLLKVPLVSHQFATHQVTEPTITLNPSISSTAVPGPSCPWLFLVIPRSAVQLWLFTTCRDTEISSTAVAVYHLPSWYRDSSTQLPLAVYHRSSINRHWGQLGLAGQFGAPGPPTPLGSAEPTPAGWPLGLAWHGLSGVFKALKRPQ